MDNLRRASDVQEMPRASVAGRLADYGDDVGLSLSRTPVRNALAGAGAFLAVAVFVFSAAATTTSANVVALSFDRLAATSVQFVSGRPESRPIDGDLVDLQRLAELPGVVGAGLRWQIGELAMRPGEGPWVQQVRNVSVSAVDLGAANFLGLTVEGSGLTPADYALARPTLLIGIGAARQFDSRLSPGMLVQIDGTTFEISGVISDAERDPGVLLEVLVPASTAARYWPTRPSSATVVVEVVVGSATTIAEEGPLILDPNHPDGIVALYDPEASHLRTEITTQVDGVAVLIGIGLLITGALGIAGTMVASVSERRDELGIRRALGSTRAQVARLIIGEAALIGLVASLAGLVAGLGAFLIVAIGHRWSPVLFPEVLLGPPVAGVIAGLIGGLIPSTHATRIEPAEALRS